MKPVEVDETFVSGKGGNMRRSKRPQGRGFTGIPTGHSAKTIVMECWIVRLGKFGAHVIPNVEREALQNEILAAIKKRFTVETDKWADTAA